MPPLKTRDKPWEVRRLEPGDLPTADLRRHHRRHRGPPPSPPARIRDRPPSPPPTDGDTDADGRLTQSEFVKVMKSNVTSPENFESAVLAIADALMSALDTNQDGVLESQEYVQMYSALGIPPEHSSDAFRRLDRDNDGTISHEEFRTAICEFYLSDDEDASGNWLIGPINRPT